MWAKKKDIKRYKKVKINVDKNVRYCIMYINKQTED